MKIEQKSVYINTESRDSFSLDASISAGLNLFAIIEVSISGHFKNKDRVKVIKKMSSFYFTLIVAGDREISCI